MKKKNSKIAEDISEQHQFLQEIDVFRESMEGAVPHIKMDVWRINLYL